MASEAAQYTRLKSASRRRKIKLSLILSAITAFVAFGDGMLNIAQWVFGDSSALPAYPPSETPTPSTSAPSPSSGPTSSPPSATVPPPPPPTTPPPSLTALPPPSDPRTFGAWKAEINTVCFDELIDELAAVQHAMQRLNPTLQAWYQSKPPGEYPPMPQQLMTDLNYLYQTWTGLHLRALRVTPPADRTTTAWGDGSMWLSRVGAARSALNDSAQRAGANPKNEAELNQLLGSLTTFDLKFDEHIDLGRKIGLECG